MTIISVPDRRPLSKDVLVRASTLTVHLVTARFALVQGSRDVHRVSFDTMTCDCTAGSFGNRCAHVCAAIQARVDSPVVFHETREDAEATEQYVYAAGAYVWTLDTTPPPLASWIAFDAVLHSLCVFEAGEPVARCSDYLDGERVMRRREVQP